MLHGSLTRDRDIDPNLPFTPSGEIVVIKSITLLYVGAQPTGRTQGMGGRSSACAKGHGKQVEKHTGEPQANRL